MGDSMASTFLGEPQENASKTQGSDRAVPPEANESLSKAWWRFRTLRRRDLDYEN